MPGDRVSGIATITNADTPGVRLDVVKRPVRSWADLMAPAFKGAA